MAKPLRNITGLRPRSADTPTPKPFHSSLKQIVAVMDEEDELNHPGWFKIPANVALPWLAKKAGVPVTRFKELSMLLWALPDNSEYRVAKQVAKDLKQRAMALPGDPIPPLTGFVTEDQLPALVASCSFVPCKPIELVGVAWHDAGVEAPETFARGHDDPDTYNEYLESMNQKLAELQLKRNHLLQEAAAAMTSEDIEIKFYRIGWAEGWYRVTNRAVPARAPGEVPGVIDLVSWLRRHRDVLETL